MLFWVYICCFFESFMDFIRLPFKDSISVWLFKLISSKVVVTASAEDTFRIFILSNTCEYALSRSILTIAPIILWSLPSVQLFSTITKRISFFLLEKIVFVFSMDSSTWRVSLRNCIYKTIQKFGPPYI